MKNILCKINAKNDVKGVFIVKTVDIFTFWQFSAFPMKYYPLVKDI